MGRFSRRAYRQRDPKWIELRRPDQCQACKAQLPAGSSAFYYPGSGHVFGRECCDAAERASRDFDAHLQDEGALSW